MDANEQYLSLCMDFWIGDEQCKMKLYDVVKFNESVLHCIGQSIWIMFKEDYGINIGDVIVIPPRKTLWYLGSVYSPKEYVCMKISSDIENAYMFTPFDKDSVIYDKFDSVIFTGFNCKTQ